MQSGVIEKHLNDNETQQNAPLGRTDLHLVRRRISFTADENEAVKARLYGFTMARTVYRS